MKTAAARISEDEQEREGERTGEHDRVRPR
jgi:hypothetical protein